MATKKIAGIKHVFFDLDRTLWDFDKNSETVIKDLIKKYSIDRLCNTTPAAFIKKYKIINHELWHLYSHKKITKEELRSTRFTKTLQKFGYENEQIGIQLEADYISRSPYQTGLLEGTIELLDYLQPNYTLHILSNGFKEVQHIKLHESGITKYFHTVFISEEMGFQKPDEEIFKAVQARVEASFSECIMIGDDYTNDIEGSLNFSWKAIYLSNKTPRVKHENMHHVKKLNEIMTLL